MIISTIVGLVLNVVMVDNATGQHLTRAILLNKKFEKYQEQKEDQENIIIGIHNDE